MISINNCVSLLTKSMSNLRFSYTILIHQSRSTNNTMKLFYSGSTNTFVSMTSIHNFLRPNLQLDYLLAADDLDLNWYWYLKVFLFFLFIFLSLRDIPSSEWRRDGRNEKECLKKRGRESGLFSLGVCDFRLIGEIVFFSHTRTCAFVFVFCLS